MSRLLAGTALFAGVSCAFAFASACASAPPAVEPAPSATVTSAPVPTVTATTTATAEAAPVEEPIRKLTFPDAACRLQADDSDGGGVVFKVSPDGAPFAQAGDPAAADLEGPFASVTFPDVTPDAKASLLVRAREIAACPAPPPPPEKKP